MYRYLTLIILIYLLASCQNKTSYSFYESYTNAKHKNKYLWLNLNYGNTPLITDQIKEYKASGQAAKEDFILQQCNLLDTSNTFLSYIFLIENINNSYVFNPQGELITFSNHKITAGSIRNQLNASATITPNFRTNPGSS